MEHIIITQLENGMSLLRPEEGYFLYNIYTQRRHSEAVVSDTDGWTAVLSGISPTPHERTLAEAKLERIAALHTYAEADKKFYIGNKAMWVGPNERANLKNAVEALAAQGMETVEYEGIALPVQTALQMISAVEAYAALHSMNEARHREAINAKRAISTVDSYDFTGGYPSPLRFGV